MSYPQKHPLRSLTKQEEQTLSRIAKASSERVDIVRRAKALMIVHAGEPFAVAASLCGFKSADSVSQLVQRFNQRGLTALSLGGSWLNMAESVQRIIVRRARSGQHPQQAQEVIDWLEQTVAGWNAEPTPFVWGGKRQQRRERAWLRRLGGSGAALVKGYSIVA
jgi:hypothetical protein